MTREEAIETIRRCCPKVGDSQCYFESALRELVPELAESEDERIINQLITLVNSSGEILLIPTNKEELIAWLNKCKESLHVSETCKENADSFTDEDEDRTINGCLLAANAERRCKRASEELLEELGLADYTKFFYEQGVEKGKRERQKEQKSAEWSEEDEAFLKVAIAICNRYSHKDIADWLKCLPERFNPQPKNEWSEEDEKIITALTKALIGSDSAEKIMLFNGVTIEMVSEWLKSLSAKIK